MRTRKRLVESSVRGAETFAAYLDQGLADRDFTAEEAEYRMLCAEVRISCTYGMLLCLSRPLRASYILGDAMGMPDTVAAEICGISRAAQRQRLARARQTIEPHDTELRAMADRIEARLRVPRMVTPLGEQRDRVAAAARLARHAIDAIADGKLGCVIVTARVAASRTRAVLSPRRYSVDARHRGLRASRTAERVRSWSGVPGSLVGEGGSCTSHRPSHGRWTRSRSPRICSAETTRLSGRSGGKRSL